MTQIGKRISYYWNEIKVFIFDDNTPENDKYDKYFKAQLGEEINTGSIEMRVSTKNGSKVVLITPEEARQVGMKLISMAEFADRQLEDLKKDERLKKQ